MLMASALSEPGDNCKLIMLFLTEVASRLYKPYLHLNAYCRHLNSIKTDCKCQLLPYSGVKKKKYFNKEKWEGNEEMIFQQWSWNQ